MVFIRWFQVFIFTKATCSEVFPSGRTLVIPLQKTSTRVIQIGMKQTKATYTNLQLRELRTYLWGLKLNPEGLNAAELRAAQRDLKAVKGRSATLPPWRIRKEPGLSYNGKWHYALANSNYHIIALIKRLTEDRSETESLK